MSRFVVIVFPGEAQAYEGTRALKDLHAEGSLALYGMAVIAKDAKGSISIKEAAESGPLGTAAGALAGGIIGLIGGPVVALAGVASGTLIGSMVDLFNYGVGEDFLLTVSDELGPGKTAIVAEIAENWTTPLDARMESLGGTVLRTWRADFEDEQIAREMAARRAEYEQLQAEFAEASAETKASLEAKMTQAKAAIEQAESRLETKLDALDKEAIAKIDALERQLATARADAKAKMSQRIATLRTEFDARSAKLRQAGALAREALAA